ncbi:hypothetical protein Hypma_012005 [Hypsizygus marmoreus]|uniref:Uncharacterized protein n=1 Tax=Hypsizygus marmoreus TaxID=39966 RepID=A0A369JNE3_HYPMA|nr:hypothetical protein Hypma_012005 [Hypsizygus marmoreus]
MTQNPPTTTSTIPASFDPLATHPFTNYAPPSPPQSAHPSESFPRYPHHPSTQSSAHLVNPTVPRKDTAPSGEPRSSSNSNANATPVRTQTTVPE